MNPVDTAKECWRIRQESHAGEIIQIPVWASQFGRIVTGLVTLPCSRIGTLAEFHPGNGGALTIEPAHCTKAMDACQILLDRLGVRLDGVIRLSPMLPGIPAGAGFGTSTSDIAAAMRLVLLVLGLPEERHIPLLSELSVRVEMASDPLFFRGQTVLFASRLGRVIENFGGGLPLMDCLSFDLGVPVQTVDLAARERMIAYSRAHITAAGRVLECLRRGIRDGDARLCARAATASAALNQEIVPFPDYSELSSLGDRFGSLGLAIAHSGSAATLLFAPGHGGLHPRMLDELRRILAADFGVVSTVCHRIGGDG